MAQDKVRRASVYAPVNIAVIKYWGKRDAKLNLPTNSSLSVTLSTDDLRAHTTATCSPAFGSDQLTLNGSEQDVSGTRMQACFRSLRAARASMEASDPSLEKLSTYGLQIVSRNNFPTAAGLASSAAGFAALVRAVADLYVLPLDATQLSEIARQGSGSACRSLFGGYVAWEMGSDASGRDSVAVQVAPKSHWPDMRAVILVASARRKDVSSSAGMQLTVATSPAMAARIRDVVPGRMAGMKKAIGDRDFDTFADLTMRDSNNFHATCLDTHPPIFYMNDSSRAAVRMIDALNAVAVAEGGGLVAAYTFDAGPNAVVYYLAPNERRVAGVLKTVLAGRNGWSTARGQKIEAMPVPAAALEAADGLHDAVVDVILTAVDDGPVVTDEHLTE